MRVRPILIIALFLSLVIPSFAFSDEETEKDKAPRDAAVGSLETVATFSGPMPTGVTVSRKGRIFVNFPRWGDKVEFTVAEVKDGKATAYPDADRNRPEISKAAERLISVQSVVVDPRDRLWIVDTGSIEFQPAPAGGPKLVGVDLSNDKVFKSIVFPPGVVHPTSYLNDVRFDLSRGQGGFAFLTDSTDKGPNGLIVVDLETGKSWRRLNDHPATKADPTMVPMVEGQVFRERPKGGKPRPLLMGSDGIAISHDGKRLYFCPLASRRLFSVSVDVLVDESHNDERIGESLMDHGEKGASDGLESDAEGRLYFTEYEQNSIVRWTPAGSFETLVHDPRVLWPDTLAIAHDGYLYFTANQLHRQARFHEGKDLREPLYSLFRVKVNASPVALK